MPENAHFGTPGRTGTNNRWRFRTSLYDPRRAHLRMVSCLKAMCEGLGANSARSSEWEFAGNFGL